MASETGWFGTPLELQEGFRAGPSVGGVVACYGDCGAKGEGNVISPMIAGHSRRWEILKCISGGRDAGGKMRDARLPSFPPRVRGRSLKPRGLVPCLVRGSVTRHRRRALFDRRRGRVINRASTSRRPGGRRALLRLSGSSLAARARTRRDARGSPSRPIHLDERPRGQSAGRARKGIEDARARASRRRARKDRVGRRPAEAEPRLCG